MQPNRSRLTTLAYGLATLLACSCAQVQFGNADAGTETGDSGPPAFEGGVLAPYQCISDPRGRDGIGKSDAPMQIWLDGTQLFECYSEATPPCPSFGYAPPLYDCLSRLMKSGG